MLDCNITQACGVKPHTGAVLGGTLQIIVCKDAFAKLTVNAVKACATQDQISVHGGVSLRIFAYTRTNKGDHLLRRQKHHAVHFFGE